MTDEQWELIGDLLPPEKPSEARGRPRSYANRELLNAIFYHEKVGGPWRYLSKNYPHWNSVYAYFRRWSEDGTLERIHDHLRRQVRLKVGKSAEPSVLIFDSQSVKSTEIGGNSWRTGKVAFKRPSATTLSSTSRAASDTSE